MSLFTFRAIRILRVLPHTARFDRHLDDCAAFVTLYAPTFEEGCGRLRWTHLFGLVPLPSLVPGGQWPPQVPQIPEQAMGVGLPRGFPMQGHGFNSLGGGRRGF